ncbi:cache domain-containing sensor histidine kinase [Cohnella silvisoli]|uniref:histidine kinase n=1 Tax=Cohnella silvisoli TaxID=2873699 RepID=A0ABV1L2V8_9BACL|nr:sensor histidine kinase [Cohnella silvisoli]MCD9025862.1 sensor histidine kinase [Cohnella silvisoli]
MWNRLFNKKSSVQRKILVSFLGLIIFPLGLFSYASMSVSKETIRKKEISSSLKTLELIADKLNIMASDLTAISNLYFANSSLYDLLKPPQGLGIYEENAKKDFLIKTMINYKYAYTWMDYNTTLFGKNGFELHTYYEGRKIGLDSIKNEPWYAEVVKANSGIVWVSDPSPKLIPTVDDDHFVSAVRILKDFESGTMLGIFLISVSESFLYKQYGNAVQDYEQVLLIDDKGIVISAPDKKMIGQAISSFGERTNKLADESGHFTTKVNKRNMLITYDSVGKTGWKIIAYTPLKELYADIGKIERLTILLFLSVLAISILVSYFIARRLSIPIQRLFTSMKKVEMGNLSERSDVTGEDEIGELARKFNRMVSRIEDLRDRVSAEQEMKRKTEFRALQSQINTHFLYNTLASIRSMLMIDPPEKVDAIIVALVRLLKKTLTEKGEFIPIAEEMDNLRNYIRIQEARQHEHLRVVFEVDEQIMHLKTLKLLLQPIVENAIFHGIEPKPTPGTVLIQGELSDNKVWFRIRDDGVGYSGFPPSDTELDITELVLEQSAGMGLRNIRDRIRLHYGAGGELSVISRSEGGTDVVLSIPAIMDPEELKL